MLKYEEIIRKMTLEEKASMCDGLDYWHSQPVERLGIPSIALNDGPHGIRKKGDPEKAKNGETTILKGVPAICFPTASATACSWDTELIEEMGKALGDECLKEQVSVLLGPGTNIKRSPLCGRNFEYFSEDPVLAGEMSAAFIKGVQSKGIGTSLKHFAANNQETRRMTVSSVVDERALRELYLLPFEIAVKKSQPKTVMCSYNRVNGTYAAENDWLLNKILRDEFGFEGIVVTDWGAENQRVEGLLAGQELEMPTSSGSGEKLIIEAVKNGKLAESVLDKAVDNIIDLVKYAEKSLDKNYTYDVSEHHAFARKIAEQCMVLMKNENNLLPLNKNSRISVVGEMARIPRYQGAGSSLINPLMLDNACDTLTEMGISYTFSQGYGKGKKQKLISEAVENSKDADAVLLFIGLTDEYETEGNDRKHLRIPQEHIELLESLCAVNRNIVVVLAGGAVVEMPWADKVPAILNQFLTGEGSGNAVCRILFGDVNPCGKLSETYPFRLDDNSSYNYFPGAPLSVEYRESIYVGYRYYDTAKKPVRFPFGHGLSYTQFEYSDLKLDKANMNDNDTLTVSLKVKNIGKRDGAEIVQLYVRDTEATAFRPYKELKGFKKLLLAAGEEKQVEFKLSKRAFAYYDTNISDWHVETGDFEILIGASSQDIRLSSTVFVESTSKAEHIDLREKLPSYYNACVMNVPDNEFEELLGHPIPPSQRDKSQPMTLLNTIEDSDGKWGRRINKLLIKILGEETMAGAVARQTPIKNFISMSFGLFSEEMAKGLLLILDDDKLFKGLGIILKGVPNLIKHMDRLKKI